MADHRHLANAPLVEALLDIHVEPAPGFDFDQLARMGDLLAPRYKRKGERRHTGVELHVDRAETSAKTTHVREGIIFQDESEKRIVQVTLTGFTQNVLKPYSTFESLVEEAKRNWQLYVEIAKPQRIIRTALRYINDLRLPIGPGMRFEDYLPYVPSIPQGLSQTTSDFATRMTILDDKLSSKVIVAQLFQGTIDDDGVQVILDIDAICEREIGVDDNALWDRFATLRKLKNDVFFSYTTDTLLKRYE